MDHRILPVALLALCAAMLSSAALAAITSDEQGLIDLERQRGAAIAAHDTAFLNSLYADDFKGVTAIGFQADKQTLMQVFARDNPDAVFTLDHLEPRIYGDTAILMGRLTARDKTGHIRDQSRYIHVYLRREGKWALVAGEGTAIPQPTD